MFDDGSDLLLQDRHASDGLTPTLQPLGERFDDRDVLCRGQCRRRSLSETALVKVVARGLERRFLER